MMVHTSMKTNRLLLVILTLTTGLVAMGSLSAQETPAVKDPAGFRLGKKVFSGPQPGEKLKGFPVIPPSRNDRAEEFDPVALAAGKPHFLVFLDDSDIAEGIGAWLHVVERIKKNSRSGLAASAVILGDERTTDIPFVRMSEKWWTRFNSAYQIGYSPDGRDGPGAYGLNRNIVMTILIADAKGKVLYNFPFRETLQDRPDPHVVGALAKAVGADRETVASWLKQKRSDKSKMQMREEKSETRQVIAKRIIDHMDKNGDGKISKDEASAHFDQVDANKDGVIDVNEAKLIADYANQQNAKSMRMDSKGEKK